MRETLNKAPKTSFFKLLLYFLWLNFWSLSLSQEKSIIWCEFFEEFNHFILERPYINDIPYWEHVIFLYIVQVRLIHKFKSLLSLLIRPYWGNGNDLEPIDGIILVKLILFRLVVPEHGLFGWVNLVDQCINRLWHSHQVLDSVGIL